MAVEYRSCRAMCRLNAQRWGTSKARNSSATCGIYVDRLHEAHYMVYILCFSLIMLSVDLSSPHIKNKMSKREFIRNVRQAVHRADDELYGHLYDDVYLRGHVAPNSED
ncbi:putative guanine nucleotide exchange factor [Ixodes scapularis]